MSMTTFEKEAVVEYVEYQLVNICEQLNERLDTQTSEQLYELAYQALNDIDVTLQQRVDIVMLQCLTNKNN